MRANLELNATLAANVRVREAAVADVSGRLRLYDNLGSSKACVTQPHPGHSRTLEVEGLTLDELVYGRGEPPPHLMKLDIEGAEGLALSGGRRLLREARPLFLMEVHGNEAAQSVWEELQQANYQLTTLERTTLLEGPSQLAHVHVLAVPQ